MPDTLDSVAPINRRFFRAVETNPNLSETAREAIIGEAARSSLELEGLRNQREETNLKRNIGEVRLEREHIALRSLREEESKERDLASKSEEVGAQLQNVLDDPALDSEQKRSRINRLGLQHGDLLPKSPAIREKFRSAEGTLPPTLTPYQRISLKRSDDARALANDANEIKAKQKADKEVEDEKKEMEELENDAFDKAFSNLRSVKFATDETKFNKDGGDIESNKFEKPASSTEARVFLELYGDVPINRLDSMDDRELFDSVLDTYRKRKVASARKVTRPQGDKVSRLNIPKK